MDVLDILDSLIILVILVHTISPSCKVARADNPVEVIHHLVGEFGGKQSDGGSGIKPISSFIGKGFKFGDESIYFPWGEGEMMEFFLCTLHCTSVLECLFESSGNSIPIVFVCRRKPSVILVKGPYSPVFDPIFDVFSLNEPQKKRCSFHGVIDLICTNIGQAA